MDFPSSPLPGPTRDRLDIGSGALARAVAAAGAGYTLITQPGPAQSAGALLTGEGVRLLATGLDRATLAELAAGAAPDRTVVGVGGGVVMDSAKFVAATLGQRLLLAPSALSVDACVTPSVAIRDGGSVTYEHFIVAERIAIDVDLIAAAPVAFNRAGAGDIISCHSALWDWREASRSGPGRGAPYDAEAAAIAAAALDRVERAARAVAVAGPDGLTALATGYADINDLTVGLGHPQMEEGTEHYFAYRVEAMTDRSFVHGELVTLGTVLAARAQANDPERVSALADTIGISWRPSELGLSREVLEQALRDLPSFVIAHDHPAGVVDLRPEAFTNPAGLLAGFV